MANLKARVLRRISRWIEDQAYALAHVRSYLATGVYVEVGNPIEWQIYTDIFVDGDYDAPLLRLFERQVDEPLTVVDLGANVGYFALRVAHLAAVHSIARPINVEGVEASGSLCALARERWSACRLKKCRVHFNVTHGLVGKRSGEAKFYERPDHGNNSMFRKRGRGETLPYLDVADHFSDIDSIDLIKCDIEGAEEMFFESYPDLLKKTRAMVVELHSHLCDPAHCTALLKAAGFTEHRVLDHKYFDCSLEYFSRDAAPID